MMDKAAQTRLTEILGSLSATTLDPAGRQLLAEARRLVGQDAPEPAPISASRPFDPPDLIDAAIRHAHGIAQHPASTTVSLSDTMLRAFVGPVDTLVEMLGEAVALALDGLPRDLDASESARDRADDARSDPPQRTTALDRALALAVSGAIDASGPCWLTVKLAPTATQLMDLEASRVARLRTLAAAMGGSADVIGAGAGLWLSVPIALFEPDVGFVILRASPEDDCPAGQSEPAGVEPTASSAADLEPRPSEEADSGPAGAGAGEDQPAPLEVERGHVLVVDDSNVNVAFTIAMLDRLGYTSTPAASGKQALALVREISVDAVLLDLQMPGMDGFETARSLTARYPSGATPALIAMSADEPDDYRAAGKAAGFTAFLIKPFGSEDLQRTLESALSKPA